MLFDFSVHRLQFGSRLIRVPAADASEARQKLETSVHSMAIPAEKVAHSISAIETQATPLRTDVEGCRSNAGVPFTALVSSETGIHLRYLGQFPNLDAAYEQAPEETIWILGPKDLASLGMQSMEILLQQENGTAPETLPPPIIDS